MLRVLVIICLAASLLVAAIEVIQPSVLVDRKIDEVRYGDLPAIAQALEIYKQKHGTLPTESEGVPALAESSGARGESILPKVPKDPWFHDYVYRRTAPGKGYVIYSIGRNGVDESGNGDDIVEGPKKYSCAEYGGCRNWIATMPIVALAIAAIAGVAIVLLLLGGRISRVLVAVLHRK